MKEQLVIEFPVASLVNRSILRALAYSEVFSYPLTQKEIFRLMDRKTEHWTNLEEDLNHLKSLGMIYEINGYYSLNAASVNIERRMERNRRSERYLRIAKVFSAVISTFPFVRGVFLSGSLTKNSVDKDSDIDYFIITEPGRLWLTRTFLILFKKIFLLNSYKFFCLNYFLSSDNLEVQDKNLYTANEIATLIPTYNATLCTEFFRMNKWVRDFLPNAVPSSFAGNSRRRSWLMKSFGEWLFSGLTGEKLEAWFFSLTISYWKRKYAHLPENEINNVTVSLKHMNAHHPVNFKSIALERQREILSELEFRHQLS